MQTLPEREKAIKDISKRVSRDKINDKDLDNLEKEVVGLQAQPEYVEEYGSVLDGFLATIKQKKLDNYRLRKFIEGIKREKEDKAARKIERKFRIKEMKRDISKAEKDKELEKLAFELGELMGQPEYLKEYGTVLEDLKEKIEEKYSLVGKGVRFLKRLFSRGKRASQIRTASKMLNELNQEIKTLSREKKAFGSFSTSYILEETIEEDGNKTRKEIKDLSKTLQREIQDLKKTLKKADLVPPLGKPGGIEHTRDRIIKNVADHNLELRLIKKLEQGQNIPNSEAREVYTYVDCNKSGLNKIKQFCISSHAQYRMDQRGISVHKLKSFFFNLEKYYERNEYNLRAKDLISAIDYGMEAEWTDPMTKNLTVAFEFDKDTGTAKIITAYYKNKRDPVKV